MKITRRQLRQIIKEEIGFSKFSPVTGISDQRWAQLSKAIEDAERAERLGTSERPDYPESDPDMPFPVSQQEFEADNQKEIKALAAHLRPAMLFVVDRILDWAEASGELGMEVPPRSYLVKILDEKYLDEMAADVLYLSVMGESATPIKDVIDKAKNLRTAGPELDDLMDEFEMAITSDSYTGEPIIDEDAMKVAAQAFKDTVMGL